MIAASHVLTANDALLGLYAMVAMQRIHNNIIQAYQEDTKERYAVS